MRAMDTDRYVSAYEASKRLGMHGGDLYMLIFQGRVRAKPTLEHGVLVPVEEVERLLRERGEQPPGAAV